MPWREGRGSVHEGFDERQGEWFGHPSAWYESVFEHDWRTLMYLRTTGTDFSIHLLNLTTHFMSNIHILL